MLRGLRVEEKRLTQRATILGLGMKKRLAIVKELLVRLGDVQRGLGAAVDWGT